MERSKPQSKPKQGKGRSSKIMLRLTPSSPTVATLITKHGYNPNQELVFKKSKPISFVITHLETKWHKALSITEDLHYNVRLVHQRKGANLQWKAEDTTTSAETVAKLVGISESNIFELQFDLFTTSTTKTDTTTSTSKTLLVHEPIKAKQPTTTQQPLQLKASEDCDELNPEQLLANSCEIDFNALQTPLQNRKQNSKTSVFDELQNDCSRECEPLAESNSLQNTPMGFTPPSSRLRSLISSTVRQSTKSHTATSRRRTSLQQLTTTDSQQEPEQCLPRVLAFDDVSNDGFATRFWSVNSTHSISNSNSNASLSAPSSASFVVDDFESNHPFDYGFYGDVLFSNNSLSSAPETTSVLSNNRKRVYSAANLHEEDSPLSKIAKVV